jgi:hypothetical protein
METTFSLRKDAGPTPSGTDLRQLAQDWWNHHQAELRACYSTAVNFVSVTLRDMSSSAGQEGVYNIPGGTNGTHASDPTPYSNALVASLRSSFVGRSGRGRWYFTGLGEDTVSGNSATAGQALLVAAAAGLMASFSGNATFATTPVIASRQYLVLRPILTVIVDIFVDSQRRRLTGRGS